MQNRLSSWSPSLSRGCAGLLLLAVMMMTSAPAQAALGDDVTQVAADQVRLKARLRIHPRADYTIHELAAPTGVTVRQYIGGAGKVFAVSWSGGWRPNLRDVMGSHYDRYLAATRGKRRARGPVRLELPGMVVFMAGYQRAFVGHVYLTDMAPPSWLAARGAAQ